MGETCFNAYDNRNGVSWTISRMVGESLIQWLKIRPFRMIQHQITDPISYEFTVHEYINSVWSEIYRETRTEGEIIDVEASDAALRIVFLNGDMNRGTMDIECCFDISEGCNLNVSIYDGDKKGVEGAIVTYASQTNQSSSSGFVSFLVPCDTVSDVHIELPSDYSCGAPYSPCDYENVAVTGDPENPHTIYVQVAHTPPVPPVPGGLTLVAPSVVMAGDEVELTGTCDTHGLSVSIFSKKTWLGFSHPSFDVLIATTTVDAGHKFSTTVIFDDFGAIELYAQMTDDIKTSGTTVCVITWTVVIALLIGIGLILEKKYNKLGIFKKR